MISKYQIRNAIFEIQKPYPADDLIVSYRDFLTYRDVLRHFHYNEKVFEHLLSLTTDMWNTQKRIDRSSLLNVTKRYFARAPSKVVSAEMQGKVFWLFSQVVVDENLGYRKEIIDTLKFSANNMLTGMLLTDEQIRYLIDHVEFSFHLLNRILRYPQRSPIISEWVSRHFLDDVYRIRRAEMVGWMLDNDPDFKLDMAVLTDDFEYLYRLDTERIQSYEADYEAYKAIKKELGPVFETEKERIFSKSGFTLSPFIDFKGVKPEFTSARKFYHHGLQTNEQHEYRKPDLPRERKHFYAHRELILTSTMGWAIAYSRLDANEKVRLLKRYFNPEIDYVFVKLGIRIGSVEFLEWLGQGI